MRLNNKIKPVYRNNKQTYGLLHKGTWIDFFTNLKGRNCGTQLTETEVDYKGDNSLRSPSCDVTTPFAK